MKPVTEDIQAAIEHLREQQQFGKKIEEDAGRRNGLVAWMASNFEREHTDVTYPDEGVLREVLTAMLLNMAYEADEAVNDIVDMFETMITELNIEYFAVPPQRNLFQIIEPMLRSTEGVVDNTRHGVPDEDKRKEQMLDLSDLSDLTELSDDTASQDENHLDIGTNKDSITKEQQGQDKGKKNVARSTAPQQKHQIDKAQELEQEEEAVNEYDKAYTSSVTLTRGWRQILEKAQIVGIPEKEDVPEKVTTEVVGVVRAMKKVGKGTYRTPQFRRALKESGVTAVIEKISDPVFKLLNRNARMLWLEHVYRIGDQLAEVLDKWTPLEIRDTWGKEPTHFISETNGNCMIKTPKEFIEVFIKHHEYVPGEENLSFCFFLTSQENFVYHYDRWLGKLLVKLKYDGTTDVGGQKDESYRRENFQEREVANNNQENVVASTIAKTKMPQTAGVRTMLSIRIPTPYNAWAITKCQDRAYEDTPRGVTGSSVGDTNPVKLDGLEPDVAIIKRCGHQLMIVLEEEDISEEDIHRVEWNTINKKDIVDVIWWRPFDDEKLALLQDTIVESTGVQALKRGGQFRSFGGGEMIPIGARTPAGGRKGDAYTSYAGLEASTQHGLEMLFNQAATSAIMIGAAKIVYPKLAIDLRDSSIECDRIGMTGANIYNCTGYMAPIHQDEDVTRGLCVQALLSADTTYKEYAFCNVEYQYYITTTTNCMWSFKSDNLHGTMLPSTETIKNLNSHAIDPRRMGTGSAMGYTSTMFTDENRQGVDASQGSASMHEMAGGPITQGATSGRGNEPRGRRGRGRGGRGRGGRGNRARDGGGSGVVIAGAPQGNAAAGNANRRRGRVTVSNGAHVAVTRRNQNRAVENARRRAQYGERSAHWRR
ncbi:hypothetical protein EV360DRAFT_72807 [Lentinula raphanica]|nr:hypothetical protein EV360DRAFT_72807 [Lentinula raphanica]